MNTTLLDHHVLGPELARTPYGHPFRAEFRAWLREHATGEPEPLDQDARFEFRRRWHHTMAAGGWTGLHWPVEYGGRGADPELQFMYYEELALARAPEPVNTPGLILLGPTLMAHGSDLLKRAFLPGILSGGQMWCQGFSEPDSGSDLASLRTRAELDGDDWVVTGQKTWTTFGQYADFCFVLARTEPGSARHHGLSMLICPLDQPNVTVHPIRQISGDAEFCEIFFEGARVPRDWVVGEAGQGWQVAMTLFQFERGDQGYTDHARLLVRLLDCERVLGAADLPPERALAAREELRRLWVRCQELRLLNYRGTLLAAAGQSLGAVGSMTNLVWGELEKDLGSLQAEVAGARGLVLGRHDTHHRLASRAASIYSGTSEIQRNIISERLLGLPR
ncbi:putative acyl-CoA dehydrogenase FadE [Acrocarpospora pleiomorpha]|uniref:Putative acyl-CoA dehydrogenase FadE n=1 Tax=Acrocarpospora pleiomorpha TaxID=90975 RepID=A0A5M3XP53_9ACTN|nr:acyl-CoA dehydrogenase family protein [Acrocarpospora pleiomorpha]GES20018.1 putative acyl-CoA dehydrogenase FadE [Acrocarpospora pleiomorpha]